MKLHPDKTDGPTINGMGLGWIAVNGEKKTASIVLSSRGPCVDWNCRQFDQLSASHFAQLAALAPELVIFGSGTQLRFPPAAWLQSLMAQRIGLETMDTAAACRTYNILASEGRHVVAALLLEQL
jgi:uncharacterized protein